MAAQAQANAIALVLIILVGIVAVSSLPISPSLTVTFQIATTQTYPYVALNILPPSYQKVSFLAYWGSQRDTMTLYAVSAQNGNFMVIANVTYAGVTVSSPIQFPYLGIGTYQLKVTYFPRQEQQGIPYVVSLKMTVDSVTSSYLVNVFPS